MTFTSKTKNMNPDSRGKNEYDKAFKSQIIADFTALESGGGGEDATSIGTLINSTSAATPNDSDLVAIAENAGILKKLSLTNLKAFLKTYFDTLYASTSGGSETTTSMGTLINSAGAATPNDSDLIATAEASGLLKKLSWTNAKAFLKTYFDTLYLTKNTWTTFSPTLTAGTGSITAYTINTARYKLVNDLCYVDIIFTLTTAGTASNYLKLGEMPKKFNAGRSVVINGREFQNSGLPIQGCAIAPDTATDKYLLIRTMTNTYRGSSGDIFSLQGFYPVHPDDL